MARALAWEVLDLVDLPLRASGADFLAFPLSEQRVARTSLSFDRLPSAVHTSDVALTDDESSVWLVGGGKLAWSTMGSS